MPKSQKTNQMRCTPLNKKKCEGQDRCAWLPSQGCRAAGTQGQLEDILDEKLTESVMATFQNEFDMNAEQTRAMAIAELLRNAPRKGAKQGGCTKYSKKKCNTLASCEWKEGRGCRKPFSQKGKLMKATLPMDQINQAMRALSKACQERYAAEKKEKKADKEMKKLKDQMSKLQKNKDKNDEKILTLSMKMAKLEKDSASMPAERVEREQAKLQKKVAQAAVKQEEHQQQSKAIKQKARQVNKNKKMSKRQKQRAQAAQREIIQETLKEMPLSSMTSQQRAEMRKVLKQQGSNLSTELSRMGDSLLGEDFMSASDEEQDDTWDAFGSGYAHDYSDQDTMV
ncbi:MAG: hypothetical protein K0U52_09055 [Gammaproteobacteria bacterium]|nr:hypothetical protein [Gammaproteobacteria bacterium]